jgi:hypothetical protein
LPILDGFDYANSTLRARRRKRIDRLVEQGLCETAFIRGARYYDNFRIPLQDDHAVLVQVGALQAKSQRGGVRILLNPARLEDGDAERMHDVIGRALGEDEYREALSQARINVLDFAVDVEGVCLDDLLINYTYAQRRTVFGKGTNSAGRLETWNFGSVSSDHFASVYAKDIERRHVAALRLAKADESEPLTANFIKQLDEAHDRPPTVRFEVRSSRLRGRAVRDLYLLPNRFARFQICDVSKAGAELSPLMRQAFVSMVRDMGLKGALSAFNGTAEMALVRDFWASHRVGWWDPETLWPAALDALRYSDVFPRNLFEVR